VPDDGGGNKVSYPVCVHHRNITEGQKSGCLCLLSGEICPYPPGKIIDVWQCKRFELAPWGI
jgi:hypothetical protein